jgi:hypothetical protein
MFRSVSIILLLISFPVFNYAQKWKLTRYELHFGLGTTNVFGDIGGTADANNLLGFKDIKIKETGLSIYAGGRYKLKMNQAVKINLIFGFAQGSDLESKNADRMFSYKTSILELSGQYEYYFITEDRSYSAANLYNRRGMINNFSRIALYGFGGFGGVLCFPKFTHNGRLPIPSIEQYENSTKFAPIIPIGIGAKMAYNKYWSIGFEFGRRFAFTDYLDGFTTSFSKAKDTYYFAVFHLVYKIETDRFGKPLLFKRHRL